MIALLLSLASAAEHHVVRTGDTLASVAEALGDPALAETVRTLNGLDASAPLVVGTVLHLPAPAHAEEEGGVVLHVRGGATARFVGGGEADLLPGLTLPLGTTVCTEDDSFATLRLTAERHGADHDEITLLEATCVVVAGSGATYGQRTALVNLEQGAVDVRLSEASGQLAIATVDGVTAASDGGFRVAKEDDATRTEAVSAPVSVMGAGVEVELQVGQGSRVKAGEAPSSPVELPSAVVVAGPLEGEVLRVPSFAWEEVDRALGYRLEIATEADFTALVFVQETDQARYDADLLFLPYRVPGLWWRVSSFDLNGFQGVPSAGTFLLSPGGSTL